MWEQLKSLVLGLEDKEEGEQNLEPEELRVASAALLVHAAGVDGVLDPQEQAQLATLVAKRFNLSNIEAAELIEKAHEQDRDAVDLYGFTSIITRHLDQPGRQDMVKMLWHVVLADGEIHEFESNLVWRAAELLGVSTRDRVSLRQAVEQELAQKPS